MSYKQNNHTPNFNKRVEYLERVHRLLVNHGMSIMDALMFMDDVIKAGYQFEPKTTRIQKIIPFHVMRGIIHESQVSSTMQFLSDNNIAVTKA